ncbi:MAG: bacillithiol biosynthesis deacetylase BshB1 [Fibrobacteria bacterium]|nr:bacillithiol biosynthesis deacetylase BshB1 [Fibrobacteria bacterium]
MSKANNKMDFMAIGAHADDIELMAGGTVAKLVKMGKKGVFVDVTDASAGTRGSSEIRQKEALQAAKSLGILHRENLALPDSRLENNQESQLSMIAVIRKYRPKILLTHYFKDEHPDHIATAEIVDAARFKAGLKNFNCPGRAFRPERLFHFMGPEYFEPTFCVDISEYWTVKMKSVLCYKSQFFNSSAKEFKGKTDIASPEFLEYLEYKHRFFGWRIRRKYAEPFFCKEIPEMGDLTNLGGKRF